MKFKESQNLISKLTHQVQLDLRRRLLQNSLSQGYQYQYKVMHDHQHRRATTTATLKSQVYVQKTHLVALVIKRGSIMCRYSTTNDLVYDQMKQFVQHWPLDSTFQLFQVLNIFIMVKITKSSRFRRQFRRNGEEEAEEDEVEETSSSSRSRHLRVLAKLTHPGQQGHMSADSRSGYYGLFVVIQQSCVD